MHRSLVFAALIAVPACGAKIAAEPSDGAVIDAPLDTTDATPQSCTNCVQSKCPAQWGRCLADATCGARLDCFAACTSDACQQKCAADHPSASADSLQPCFLGVCRESCTTPSR